MKNIFLIILIINASTSLTFSQNKDKKKTKSYLELSWKKVARDMPKEWYASDEAKLVAENVLLSQKDIGGWAKNKPYHHVFTEAEKADFIEAKPEYGATFDNGATITEMEFMAKVYTNFHDEKYKLAFDKGLNYIFLAQYENGGWPQFYPCNSGDKITYRADITYNDNAMVNIMELLADIITNKNKFTELQITDEAKNKAQQAFNKGIQCILNTQIKVNGAPSVWCTQHNYKTLQPSNARSYELASFSGSESVDITLLLMEIENPSEEIIAAVKGAVSWFENHKITGIKVEKVIDADGKKNVNVIEDKKAPATWARFYDLETEKPFFCNRDGIKHNTLAEIEPERRNGYKWYTQAPEKVFENYQKWKKSWM